MTLHAHKMETKYKQIGAALLVVITIASGVALYLEKTDDYHNYRGQWIENQNGSYTCSSDGVTDYCYEIESRGSGWYRCYIGNPVNIDEEPISHLGIEVFNCDHMRCKLIK